MICNNELTHYFVLLVKQGTVVPYMLLLLLLTHLQIQLKDILRERILFELWGLRVSNLTHSELTIYDER